MKDHLSVRFMDYLHDSPIQTSRPKDPQEVILQWKLRMFQGINKQKQNKYSLEKYPWHIFSFGLKPSLEGTHAIIKYQSLIIKSFYLIIYQEERLILCESNECIPYSDLITVKSGAKKQEDIYICHQNFKWTFVVPHEKTLGPYLYVGK